MSNLSEGSLPVISNVLMRGIGDIGGIGRIAMGI